MIEKLSVLSKKLDLKISLKVVLVVVVSIFYSSKIYMFVAISRIFCLVGILKKLFF